MHGVRVPRTRAYLGACCVLLWSGSSAFAAHSEEVEAGEAEAGEVLVLGNRPTSLPTEIPTTIEGISASEIQNKVNATDAEDALKYFPSLLVRKRYIGDYD